MRRKLSLVGSIAITLFATTALFAAPSITSLSPTSVPSGAVVTITGSGFGATKGTSYVTVLK